MCGRDCPGPGGQRAGAGSLCTPLSQSPGKMVTEPWGYSPGWKGPIEPLSEGLFSQNAQIHFVGLEGRIIGHSQLLKRRKLKLNFNMENSINCKIHM